MLSADTYRPGYTTVTPALCKAQLKDNHVETKNYRSGTPTGAAYTIRAHRLAARPFLPGISWTGLCVSVHTLLWVPKSPSSQPRSAHAANTGEVIAQMETYTFQHVLMHHHDGSDRVMSYQIAVRPRVGVYYQAQNKALGCFFPPEVKH